MSFHRENVVWQSPDGTWNRGFFTSYYAGDSSADDFDPEWDVEYDNGEFSWVSTGHATQEAALASWNGANPGGYDLVDEQTSYVIELDNMAQECKARAAEFERELRARRNEHAAWKGQHNARLHRHGF